MKVVQGASKKSGICFVTSISIKLNTNPLSIYLILKLGSIVSYGIQKHDCMISWNPDISKTIWGIIFQKFKIMNNLIPLKLIQSQFMHDFSSYDYFKRLGSIPWRHF